MKLFKRIALSLFLILLLSGILLWSADTYIKSIADGKTYNDTTDIPPIKVGLLLGTAKNLKNGYPNQYFFFRTDATAKLFKAGKIKYVIISGDNSRSTYDEPTDMKNELIKNGVDSTKIYLDYAGFRT